MTTRLSLLLTRTRNEVGLAKRGVLGKGVVGSGVQPVREMGIVVIKKL